MTRIEKIPHITPAEIDALRSQGIRSSADLWRSVAQDMDHGIDDLAEATGIKKERLVELLKNLALYEAERKGSWVGRHWLELVILAAMFLIIALLYYARITLALA